MVLASLEAEGRRELAPLVSAPCSSPASPTASPLSLMGTDGEAVYITGSGVSVK